MNLNDFKDAHKWLTEEILPKMFEEAYSPGRLLRLKRMTEEEETPFGTLTKVKHPLIEEKKEV